MDQLTASVSLTTPQLKFAISEQKFPALVAGFGSGKTEAIVARGCFKKLAYPACNIAYYAPTYSLIDMIAIPRFCEYFDKLGFDYNVNHSDYYIDVQGAGRIWLRSMSKPERIVGYEVADSLIDELDTLKTEVARNVWQKIIARNRQKKPDGATNTTATATTPEGFRFTYERWKDKPPSNQYRLYRASTRSNRHNLPDDYIDALTTDYPEQLLAAYIEGIFVNLNSAGTYPMFDRDANHGTEKIRDGETLYIGMDFNVGKMAASVCVERNERPIQIGEFYRLLDTPAMIDAIEAHYPNHPVYVYCDASGGARKTTGATQTDITLLQEAGYTVVAEKSNPPIIDRVKCLGTRICNGKGERFYKVDADACPETVKALEQQVNDAAGLPDKTKDNDHLPDGLGYLMMKRYPVGMQEFRRKRLYAA